MWCRRVSKHTLIYQGLLARSTGHNRSGLHVFCYWTRVLLLQTSILQQLAKRIIEVCNIDPAVYISLTMSWRHCLYIYRDTLDWHGVEDPLKADKEQENEQVECYQHTWPKNGDVNHRFHALSDYVIEVESASAWTENNNQTVVSVFNINYQHIGL